jgi:hypothetical protein
MGVRRARGAHTRQCPATLSEVLGRPIAHVRVDVPTFQSSSASEGLPDFVIEVIVEAARLAPQDEFVASDDVARRILGRPASRLRDWIERNREPRPASVAYVPLRRWKESRRTPCD